MFVVSLKKKRRKIRRDKDNSGPLINFYLTSVNSRDKSRRSLYLRNNYEQLYVRGNIKIQIRHVIKIYLSVCPFVSAMVNVSQFTNEFARLEEKLRGQSARTCIYLHMYAYILREICTLDKKPRFYVYITSRKLPCIIPRYSVLHSEIIQKRDNG